MVGRAIGRIELGVVSESAPADLLIFAADPKRTPAAYESLPAVVANGRYYYDRGTLDLAARAANALGASGARATARQRCRLGRMSCEVRRNVGYRTSGWISVKAP